MYVFLNHDGEMGWSHPTISFAYVSGERKSGSTEQCYLNSVQARKNYLRVIEEFWRLG